MKRTNHTLKKETETQCPPAAFSLEMKSIYSLWDIWLYLYSVILNNREKMTYELFCQREYILHNILLMIVYTHKLKTVSVPSLGGPIDYKWSNSFVVTQESV